MDRRYDVATALAVVVLGVVVIVAASGIGAGPVPDPLGPAGVPNMLGTVFIIGGLTIAVRRIRAWKVEGTIVPHEGDPDDVGEGIAPGSTLRAMTICALMLAYIQTLEFAGYPLTTMLFVAACLWTMDIRSLRLLVGLPVVLTVSLYLVFTQFLGIRLPGGFTQPLLRQLGLVA